MNFSPRHYLIQRCARFGYPASTLPAIPAVDPRNRPRAIRAIGAGRCLPANIPSGGDLLSRRESLGFGTRADLSRVNERDQATLLFGGAGRRFRQTVPAQRRCRGLDECALGRPASSAIVVRPAAALRHFNRALARRRWRHARQLLGDGPSRICRHRRRLSPLHHSGSTARHQGARTID